MESLRHKKTPAIPYLCGFAGIQCLFVFNVFILYVDDFNKKKKFLEENMPMLYK